MKAVVTVLMLSALLVLSACAPTMSFERDFAPQIISATVQDDGDTLFLQGRYFGDGADGQAAGSYVVLGGDIDAEGGVRVRPSSWSPSRITLTIPRGVGAGYVFVVNRGVSSSPFPVNLR